MHYWKNATDLSRYQQPSWMDGLNIKINFVICQALLGSIGIYVYILCHRIVEAKTFVIIIKY